MKVPESLIRSSVPAIAGEVAEETTMTVVNAKRVRNRRMVIPP